MDENDNKKNKHPQHAVHNTLAHSYAVYFLFLLAGVFLDLSFPIKIFRADGALLVGMAFLIFATIVIFWAQHTSRNLNIEHVTKATFCKGPYCYSRTPTHWGLFFLILGFGFVINAFFIIVFTIISFFITKFVFLKRQEDILCNKYGDPYLEYKKSVKL